MHKLAKFDPLSPAWSSLIVTKEHDSILTYSRSKLKSDSSIMRGEYFTSDCYK